MYKIFHGIVQREGFILLVGLPERERTSYRMCTGTKDKRLAQKIHAKMLTKATESRWFELDPASTYTFDEVMESVMRKHAPKRKVSMITRYKYALKHLNRYFSGKTFTTDHPGCDFLLYALEK